jgi:hypothetical protein
MGNNNKDLFTPGELIERYPALKKINWSAETLGIFLRSGILKGNYSNSKGSSLIDESSVWELVKYRNNLLEAQKLRI